MVWGPGRRLQSVRGLVLLLHRVTSVCEMAHNAERYQRRPVGWPPDAIALQ